MNDDVVDGVVRGAGVRGGVERNPKILDRQSAPHTEKVHAVRGGEDHILRDERAGAEAEPLAVELKLPVTDVRVRIARVLHAADDRAGRGDTDSERYTEHGDNKSCQGRQAWRHLGLLPIARRIVHRNADPFKGPMSELSSYCESNHPRAGCLAAGRVAFTSRRPTIPRSGRFPPRASHESGDPSLVRPIDRATIGTRRRFEHHRNALELIPTR